MTLYEHVTAYRQDPDFRPHHEPLFLPHIERCPCCRRCFIYWGRHHEAKPHCPDHPHAYLAVVPMDGAPTL